MFGRGKRDVAKLLEAVWSGQAQTVKEILSRNVDLVNTPALKGGSRQEAGFEEGVTALHLAARQGHGDIVELLLSVRALVVAVSASGSTPLHFAASEGHETIARILIEHGADPNAQDATGRTALHGAASGAHREVAQLLLARGARASVKDHDGNTPLHEATKTCSEPVARMLISAGANVNERNRQERTPLHVAIVSADHSAASHVVPELHARREATSVLAKSLLERGAEVNAMDSVGETPLDLMTYLEGESGSDLIDLLRANGAEWVRYRHRHPSGATPAVAGEEIVLGVSALKSKEERPTDQGEEPISLGTDPLLIGRASECDVHYKSRTLSRRHCRIEQTEDGYLITDLGSHNGTFVDGEPITKPYTLQIGELITLGAYEFEFDGTQLIPSHGELSEEELISERQRR